MAVVCVCAIATHKETLLKVCPPLSYKRSLCGMFRCIQETFCFCELCVSVVQRFFCSWTYRVLVILLNLCNTLKCKVLKLLAVFG